MGKALDLYQASHTSCATYTCAGYIYMGKFVAVYCSICEPVSTLTKVLRLFAGQTQPQSFQQHSGQSPADQRQAAAVQSSAITIHPDITLDQDTKILTVGQGQASFFGQKYTLPALPFKLPATPALNSLQTIYPSESSAADMHAMGHHLRWVHGRGD